MSAPFDAACRNPEGWGPTSPDRAFDLTPCFEEGILVPAVLALLIFCSLVRIAQLRALPLKEHAQRANVRLLRIEQTLLFLVVVISVASVVVSRLLPQRIAVLETNILELIAFTFLPFLTQLNHTRTRRSSTVILLFWPVYIFTLCVWTRTYVSIGLPLPPVNFTLRWSTAGLGLVAFVLECLGPEYGEAANVEATDASTLKTNAENPLLTANIFSVWFFSWLTPLLRKGSITAITEDDLPSLLKKDEAANLGDDLAAAMKKHKSLTISLFAAYGGPYGIAACLKLMQDSLTFLQPQLLRIFLAFIAQYQRAHVVGIQGPSPYKGFSIAILMFVASMVQSVIMHQYFQRCYETGMRVRAGLITAIYKKSLVLSNEARGQASGDIVNLMSVDATRLQDLCTYGLVSISGPFQITLAFISLYNLLGWSAFVGVGIMIFSIPLNTVIARFLKRLQETQMKNRDQRTRLMSELLANIRSVKLYAWEHAFLRRVLFVRNDLELKMMRKIAVFTALNTTLWSAIPLLVAFSSFATAAAVTDRPLTSDIIFPAISLFMLLQFPLAMFSQVITNLIEALVSVQRLSRFLDSDELQPDARRLLTQPKLRSGDVVLEIKDGEFVWSRENASPTLEGMNLTIRKGELMGVYGRVGAGKTSLLAAIIGDMRKLEGELNLYGTVAYACQNAWIMSATIRDNILFSHEYDEDFYNLVLDACALRPDLALMAQGDLTEVGEKGITMSGGQRARISLARAVYARADLTLLDDVLAAVDSHVARHVFNQVIGPRGILSTKARLLVTNSVAFITRFDQIVYLRRGIVIESGPYIKLANCTETEVYKLTHGHGHGNGTSSSATTTQATPIITPSPATPEGAESLTDEKMKTVDEKLLRQKSFARANLAAIPPPSKSSSSQGLSEETSAKGKVKVRVYWRYIEAASKVGFALFIIGTVLQQVMSVMGNIALKSWGEGNRASGDNREASAFLWIYGLLSLSSTLLGGASAVIIWVLCSLRSSKHLHDSMLNAVLRAPLTFFEVTPSGRILNLFSRDTYVVDQVLARVIQFAVRTFASCAGIVVVIGVSFPPFLVAVVPLGYLYSRFTTYYLATSRELQRLNAVSRSPLFSWFSESLNGLSTIRAFNQQSVFIAINERRIDRNQICYLPSTSVNRWLALRLEFVGAVIILIATTLSMIKLVTSSVDAGLVGLVISYALNTTSSLNWLVRSASEVEQNIVSVERMLNYIELEPEAPYEVPENKPSEEWPSEGRVEFKQYSLRYRPELDLVLRDISLSLNPAEKIGICGRTGAGKSSLLLALFRVLEPASGTIYIDGVDITKIGLHDLRSSISIVPQSPDLFEGTLRENIDPVGEYQDADIWMALGQAHLREFVESLPEGLDAPVREGGSSLSAGQRQLVCVARALLRKTKILVLDEATSAVDLQTDRAIQEIIRSPQFANVTILTIAHRLNTIMDSDRVLVLDAGKVAEFDTPKSLLEMPESAFRSLAAEAGLAT